MIVLEFYLKLINYSKIILKLLCSGKQIHVRTEVWKIPHFFSLFFEPFHNLIIFNVIFNQFQ